MYKANLAKNFKKYRLYLTVRYSKYILFVISIKQGKMVKTLNKFQVSMEIFNTMHNAFYGVY
jgi:hypothetical protein